MDQKDVDAIKLTPKLGKDQATSAMIIEAGAIKDMHGNNATAIAQTKPVTSPTYVADKTDVSLVSFELDVDAETMTLTFSEPVLASSLTVGEIVLQSVKDKDTVRVKLTTFSTAKNGKDGHDLTITFSEDDINAIKLAAALCQANASTFVAVGAGAITDIQGNKLTPILNSAAQQVKKFTADTSKPVFTGLAVNMNAGTLTMNFNEPVDVTTLKPKTLVLQDKVSSKPGSELLLTGNLTTSSKNGLQIVVKMTDEDLNALKKKLQLFASKETSALRLVKGFIGDMATTANLIAAVAADKALAAASYIGDTSKPSLVAFGLDVEKLQLAVTFSETINMKSFNPTSVTLQTSSDARSPYQFRLTGVDKMLTTADDKIVKFVMKLSDANELKFRLIGSSIAKSWMIIKAGACKDTSGQTSDAAANGVNAVQVTKSAWAADVGAPELQYFDLNINSGVLHLSFDESVDDSTLIVSNLLFQNNKTSNRVEYQLTKDSRVCSVCDQDEYKTKSCERGSNTQCSTCAKCTSKQFYTKACTATANAECSTCKTCAGNEYVSSACQGFSNAVCTKCTTKCAARTYQTSACTASKDLQCKACKACGADEYISSACSATQDTECKKLSTSCAAGEYIKAMGTTTKDITCEKCTTCDGKTKYQKRACAPTANAVCLACATPTKGREYTSSACSAGSNAVLKTCDFCKAGEYAKAACSDTANIDCQTCKTCPTGTYTKGRCTRSANTVCASCPANCDSCGSDGICSKCAAGKIMSDDSSKCLDTCDAGYHAQGSRCMKCHGTCSTCTGPKDTDCKVCKKEPVAYVYVSQAKKCIHSCLTNSPTGFPKKVGETIKCTACYNGTVGTGAGACLTCTDGTANGCTSCKPGQVMAGHSCHAKCPDGWFGPLSNGQCQRCLANCKTCTKADVCQVCQNGKYLSEGICHDVCPDPKKFGK